MADKNNPIGTKIRRALKGLNTSPDSVEINCIVRRTDKSLDEVGSLLNSSRKFASNQGITFSPDEKIIKWKDLNFRSQAEIEIAKALDDLGVVFFPNCAARVGAVDRRKHREPDFLICHNGKWGILEVDGEAYHMQRDSERNKLFESFVKYVAHEPAKDCLSKPDQVVKEFLRILATK